MFFFFLYKREEERVARELLLPPTLLRGSEGVEVEEAEPGAETKGATMGELPPPGIPAAAGDLKRTCDVGGEEEPSAAPRSISLSRSTAVVPPSSLERAGTCGSTDTDGIMSVGGTQCVCERERESLSDIQGVQSPDGSVGVEGDECRVPPPTGLRDACVRKGGQASERERTRGSGRDNDLVCVATLFVLGQHELRLGLQSRQFWASLSRRTCGPWRMSSTQNMCGKNINKAHPQLADSKDNPTHCSGCHRWANLLLPRS